ncbi:MAG: lepA [Dehalococcoidia bacterium]|nr:lepA [Dehalococcoidia bacterium]
MDQRHIRNFCIIAHIDHGKSTLADRLLEVTQTISPRDMEAQFLDQMDLERERGITIKLQPIRMIYPASDGSEYQLNLIDTPGHADFTYEVSRSLAACEGALLVVDATQGIQAQTLANLYIALESNLTIIPVVNKIDLPNADPEGVAREVADVIGLPMEDVIFTYAKEGTGIGELLEAVVKRVPPPSGHPDRTLSALIFDSKYDSYKGVMAYVRVVDGVVRAHQRLLMMVTGTTVEALEVGYFIPGYNQAPALSTGEVGYIATGLKNVRECQVGDTVTLVDDPVAEALPGYRGIKPMVFAGLYPVDSSDFPLLRDALDKLKLNDAALFFEPENSAALGPGFRCGFLGTLHMEIVQERLEREYNMNLLVTAPSVEYRIILTSGEELFIDSPAKLPEPTRIQEVQEPWMNITILCPSRYVGPVMELVSARGGEYVKMEYLDTPGRDGIGQGRDATVLLEYQISLSQILMDFYDTLKSVTQGYASLDYSFLGYRPGPLVKMDILVNGQPVDALSIITYSQGAHREGRALVEKLRGIIPRQLFDVAIQAAIGSKIVARDTVRAQRKNVLAKCYGGDVSRKRKLLEKQAEGKRRMKRVGNVEIPQDAFLAVLKIER